MGVVIKKVGSGEYAYKAVREGSKVVHIYLGHVSGERAKAALREQKELSAVPSRFRSLFWDTKLPHISLKQNARYIIERVLEYGSLDATVWLQNKYPVSKIIEVARWSKRLSDKSRNFWILWFGGDDA